MTVTDSLFALPLRLGFGCAGAWGKPWFAAERADAVLRTALDAGVRHFDTAGFYGNGEAEKRLGAGLRGFGEEVFISTKTGTAYQPGRSPFKDFSAPAIRADVEASLRRLNRERLDLVYLHGPTHAELKDCAETLAQLKEEGKISLAGVCGEGGGLSRAVETPGYDVIMGVYNIFRRENGDAFLAAKARGMGVVAIAPLAQGLYRRGFFSPRSLPDAWQAARAIVKNREALAQARAAAAMLHGVEGWTPAQLALAFVHNHPAIDLAVTTTTKPAHLHETIAAAGRRLPASVMNSLTALTP